jgi:hypothetical protein
MARNVFAAALAVVLLSIGTASALEVGLPFGFGGNTTFGAVGGGGWGSDVGARLHFSGVFALQPTVSLGLSSDNSNVGVNVDALFYLFETNGIRQYLGANVGFNVEGGDGGSFRLGGIYGVQRELVSAVDLFGQMGLGVRFEPGRIYTVNTQVGVIFYILK